MKVESPRQNRPSNEMDHTQPMEIIVAVLQVDSVAPFNCSDRGRNWDMVVFIQ